MKILIFTLFLFLFEINGNCQFVSLQSSYVRNNANGFNIGINFSGVHSTYSKNQFFESSTHYFETSLLLENNQFFSSKLYLVTAVGYEYFRKSNDKGRDNTSRNGLGINTTVGFRTFIHGNRRINLLSPELSITYLGVLHLGYGRNLICSNTKLKQEMNPNYLFIRLVLGRKRTLLTIIDLGGGMV